MINGSQLNTAQRKAMIRLYTDLLTTTGDNMHIYKGDLDDYRAIHAHLMFVQTWIDFLANHYDIQL